MDSFIDFRNSADAANGQYGLNRDTLVYFNIDPIRPERVRTFEIGYRTTLGEKVYLDGGYYFSVPRFHWLQHWLDALFIGDEQSPRAVDVYRYAANSINEVQTQGASIGLNYYIDNQFMLSGNYSWNELVKTDEDDLIIRVQHPEAQVQPGHYRAGFEIEREIYLGLWSQLQVDSRLLVRRVAAVHRFRSDV